MKKLILLIVPFLLFNIAFAQHTMISMNLTNKNRPFPLYTKSGKREIYDLYINDTTINYTGKQPPVRAINGSIPAPQLELTEGDTDEIYAHNEMMMETSFHWHRLILPNRYDSVSCLTTRPIEAGQTHLFKFPLVQHGTYWYHSHTITQEQSGLYGAFIIHENKRLR